MADPFVDFGTAADGFAAVLARCNDANLGMQSPCPDWTAQGVVDHVLTNTARFTSEFGGEVPDTGDDLAGRYAALRGAMVDALSAPGALDQMTPSPIGGGQLPASLMFGIFTTDTLLHTWDLARAIGDDVELDPELLERSWRNAIPIDDALRAPTFFGPKVPVGEDEPMQTQALAFFGRDAR